MHRTHRIAAAFVIGLPILYCGCAGPAASPYKPPTEAARDTATAERLTERAAELMASDPARAEALLREALAADLFHGPAHNNLGVVHLGRGELYEAASEFEWARKLLPGHPDPRLNLALTLERGGRIDEAISAFDAALEVYPNHLPSIMGLARTQIRYERMDERTDNFLAEIALRGDAEWQAWARGQQIRRNGE